MRTLMLLLAAMHAANGQTIRGSGVQLRGPDSQIKISATTANSGGYIFSSTDNQILMMGGVEFVGGQFVARATKASILKLSLGGFTFYGDTGLTPGSSYAPTQISTTVGTQYDVRTYGAVCDGTTDDTAAFTAAVTAVGSNRGVLVIPNGVCKVTTVPLTRSIQGVIGQGLYSSTVYSTTNAPIFSVPTVATSAEFYYLEFRDLTIQGDGSSTSQYGVSATGTGRLSVSSFSNMRFYNVRKGLYVNTSLNSAYIKFVNNVCDTTYYCVEKAVGGSGWIINSNQIASLAGGSGVYIHGSSAVGDIVINDNHIEAGAVGIDLYCDAACAYGLNNIVNGNKIDGVSVASIRAYNVERSTFLGNRGITPIVSFTGSQQGNIYDYDSLGINLSGLNGDGLSLGGYSTGKIRTGDITADLSGTTNGISLYDTGESVRVAMGQSGTRMLQLSWVYNATAGSAYGALETFGYSNPITYGASQHQVDNGNWIVNTKLILPTTTPASASATCTAGTVTGDTNYIYRCVSTDTWKRVAISTW